MAGLGDMLARQAAAGGMMREAPEAGALPPELGVSAEAPEPEGGGDLESALAGVQAAIAPLAPASQEEILPLLDQIREIAGRDQGTESAERAPTPEGTPTEEPKIPV